MKSTNKTLLLLITTLSLTFGCMPILNMNRIVGSGNVTTETIRTEDYDAIQGEDEVDIHLTKGQEGEISVTVDDNLQEYLDISVKDKVLIVKIKDDARLSASKGIHISVPIEDISKVQLVGSGDIDGKYVLKAHNFSTTVTGSGNLDLAVEASTVEAKVTGSGDLRLAGSTSVLEVDVNGSGSFRGNELDAIKTDASVSGSGNAEVVAKEMIKARVSGSGNIIYTGNPETKNIKVSGSGDISGQ